MTKVIYLSGVHGVGKTTIGNLVAKRLQNAGLKVYVFPEMSYFPDISIQTMEFQLWFRDQIRIRDMCITFLIATGKLDVIIADRHQFDIDVYTNRIISKDFYTDDIVDKIKLRPEDSLFVLSRNTTDIANSLRLRNEFHRIDWNENDIDYLENINDIFLDAVDDVVVQEVGCDNIDNAVQEIIESIYKTG